VAALLQGGPNDFINFVEAYGLGIFLVSGKDAKNTVNSGKKGLVLKSELWGKETKKRSELHVEPRSFVLGWGVRQRHT
jgi:hypothetical protein